MENSNCEHKWVFQCSDYKECQEGCLTYKLSRIDTYYCEKCLEIKEVVAKEATLCRGDSYPYWFKRK